MLSVDILGYALIVAGLVVCYRHMVLVEHTLNEHRRNGDERAQRDGD